MEEAIYASDAFCASLGDQKLFKEICKDQANYNLTKLFVQDFSSVKKKTSYPDYLIKNNESVKDAISFLHKVTKARTLFIRIPNTSAHIVSIDGEQIVYSESNCIGNCYVSGIGADEAFLAGYLHALV